MSDRHPGGEGEAPKVGCDMSERLPGGGGVSVARIRGLAKDNLLGPVKASPPFLLLHVLRTRMFP